MSILVYIWIYARVLIARRGCFVSRFDRPKASAARPRRAKIAAFVLREEATVAFMRTVLWVAVGVLSWSAAAFAEYKEVWNPPDATAHAAARGKPRVAVASGKKGAAQPVAQRKGRSGGANAAAKLPGAKTAAAKQTAAKQATAKQATVKQTTAKQTAAKQTAAKQTAAKQTPAKQATAKQATAKQATAKQATVKQATVKQATAKQTAVKQTTVKQTTAKQTTVKQAATKQTATKRRTAAAQAAAAKTTPPQPQKLALNSKRVKPAAPAAALAKPASRPPRELPPIIS
jgi:hypothetical protein